MVRDKLNIQNAEIEQAASLAEIEGLCWPYGMAADTKCFCKRIKVYPEGQLMAELSGKPVGVACAQRITKQFLDSGPILYRRLTDNGCFAGSHNPSGEIFQLVTVSVDPDSRGFNLGRKLVDCELEYARNLPGIKRIIGFTRPAGYFRYGDKMSIEEYVKLRRGDGQLVDPVLKFHLGAGARVISIHAGYRQNDKDALGYGIFIEYDMAHMGRPMCLPE